MRRALALILLALSAPALAESIHIVQPGETLSRIAARSLGHAARASEIARLNGLSDPDRIRIGQRLRIPGPGSSPEPSMADPQSGSGDAQNRVASETPEAQELGVVDASGGLELMRAGVAVEVATGARVRAGDTLRTGSAGRALVAGMNGERLELAAATTLHVREASSTLADRRLVLRVDAGTIRFRSPETPFLARYLVEAPTGQVSLRSGDALIEVVPPDRLLVSVFSGRALVQLPRGQRELVVGQGAVFRTADLPSPAAGLPSPPGLSIETTARSFIAAAAALPGQAVLFELFADADRQRRGASRRVPADDLGLASVRFEPGPGSWWLTARVLDRHGLSSEPVAAPPAFIREP